MFALSDVLPNTEYAPAAATLGVNPALRSDVDGLTSEGEHALATDTAERSTIQPFRSTKLRPTAHAARASARGGTPETREGGAVEHTPLGVDPALSSDVDDLASDGETRSGRRHCRTQHHSG